LLSRHPEVALGAQPFEEHDERQAEETTGSMEGRPLGASQD
jgi:hypothetical protein